MQMVEIRINGERGRKTLRNMTKLGHALSISDNCYVVPEATLQSLIRLGADIDELRRTRPDGSPEPYKSARTLLLEDVTHYCGKLVVEKIAQSEAIAIEHLEHPKPKYRFAALNLLDLKWGLTQDVADLCEDMAVSDTDVMVRHTAIHNLCNYYFHSGNLRIGDLFAKVVYSDAEDRHVRYAAYWCLHFLPGEMVWPLPKIDFRFPDDVNWVFVDSFVRQNLVRRSWRMAWLTSMHWVRKL